MRQQGLTYLLNQNYYFYSKNNLQLEVLKIINESNKIAQVVDQVVTSIISFSLIFIGSAVYLFFIKTKLTLYLLLASVVFIIPLGLLLFYTLKSKRRLIDKTYLKNHNLVNHLNNFNLIKANGTENFELQNFQQTKLSSEDKKTVSVSALLMTVVILLLMTLQISIIILVAFLYPNDYIFLNLILPIYLMVVINLLTPIIQTIRIIPHYLDAVTGFNKLSFYLNKQEPADLSFGEKTIAAIASIEFKNVSFTYQDEVNTKVLTDLNLKFEKNNLYIINEQNAYGKSTIFKLLLNFVKPDTGQILVNQQFLIKDLDKSSYLSKVAYLDQNKLLFNCSVLENILYTSLAINQTSLLEALTFIDFLPKIYKLNKLKTFYYSFKLPI
ncbi:ATP-binding cassette domain-containing protein [Spiroplasma clarkii]|uniref:ATP-binding cassette domain-containing protein n=1 Tax=Spiroplasma clarkii TaxID=2139 RepID=UPI001649D042|nr:ABC transporter ATP-binding protein [Spiroplasma clarkii]